MAIGCVVLWVGIPIGVLFATSRVTDTSAGQFLLALAGTLAGMILFARVLFWINRLYLRVAMAREGADEEWDEDETHFARGPLESMLVVSLVVAIVALFVWFFAFAHNPSQQVI
jgi:hypothetical protein